MVAGVVERMGLSGVEVVDDVSQLPKSEQRAIDAINEGRNVKGWFNPATGRSYVYAPNATNAEDVEAMLWHEVVAHQGLKELLGKDAHNELLDKVWESMTLEAKAEMMAYVSRGRAQSGNPIENRRAAADEYIARIAEGGIKDATVWAKIKEFVQEFIAKLGLASTTVTDTDIHNLLRASYANLQNNTTTQSSTSKSDGAIRFLYAKTPEEFETIQRKAVEQKGIVAPNLNSANVEIVDAPEHGFRNFAEAKSWAKNYIARTYSNEETGGKGKIKISNTTIDKYFARTAIEKSDSKDIHQRVLKVLPEVLKTSMEAEVHPDYLKVNGSRDINNGINERVLIHRLYGSVDVDGEICRVKITLKEYQDPNETISAYSYEATKIELLKGTLGNAKNRTSPSDSNSISATKLLKGVSTVR